MHLPVLPTCARFLRPPLDPRLPLCVRCHLRVGGDTMGGGIVRALHADVVDVRGHGQDQEQLRGQGPGDDYECRVDVDRDVRHYWIHQCLWRSGASESLHRFSIETIF